MVHRSMHDASNDAPIGPEEDGDDKLPPNLRYKSFCCPPVCR
jgi:hypothetical protein